MTEHLKNKIGDTVTHVYINPNDVVIEKLNDEYIIEIDYGDPSETSFTFMKIYVDIFIDGEIFMGVSCPEQLESFGEVKELVIEYIKDQGVGAGERRRERTKCHRCVSWNRNGCRGARAPRRSASSGVQESAGGARASVLPAGRSGRNGLE